MSRAFADTNWLVALYFDQPSRSRILRSWSRREKPTLLSSSPVLLEARNVFARASGEAASQEWKSLLTDCGSGLLVAPQSWSEIVAEAERMIDRYSQKATISAGDYLVVASAWLSGATWFLSFDQNSGARALASVLRMAIFPELSSRDKAIIARLQR
jgi:predicted nucleic acid-binding protein